MANGAARLLEAAVASGVDVCFTNPGTTEMPFVAALDDVPGVRAVLGLFEGVVTGAADGYGRITGRPALTLTHLGPGFANGIANLHNARRAHTPIVNLIGDHATDHVGFDAPLTSDIVSLASPVSGFVRTVASSDAMAAALVAAVNASLEPPGQGATLIVPVDCQWSEAPAAPVPAVTHPIAAIASDEAIARAAKALGVGKASVLFLGGHALGERGLWAAERIRVATGCRVFTETFSARVERGRHVPWFRTLPYFPERGADALADTDTLVVVGTVAPVAFFAVPGRPSRLTPSGCAIVTLAEPSEDAASTLEALADLLAAPAHVELDDRTEVELPKGSDPLTADIIGQAVVAMMPEQSIVIEEAATSGVGYTVRGPYGPAHTGLGLTGGAIGMGLPLALGAAIAAPERQVIALQADGSGMYTNQALWSMGREGVDVTVVLYSNRQYAILLVELARSGVRRAGPVASALTDLSRPDIDWVALASSMGVDASRATTADQFVDRLGRALATPGPSLVEAVL